MQLFYKPVGGAGAYVKIYDSAQPAGAFDANEKAPSAWNVFKPHATALNQKQPVFVIPPQPGNPPTPVTQFRQPLSNVACVTPVKLLATYDTPDNCFASQTVFSALLEQKVHFQVIVGGTTLYYPNATVDDYEFEFLNISAYHSFNFTSDKVTTQAPAT